MNRASPASRSAVQDNARRGFLLGLSAYGLWGILPIYFKAVAAVPAIDIVAHRVVWSIPFLAVLLTFAGGWRQVAQAVRNRKTLGLLAVSALLIAVNWLLYVYAVTSGQILAGSLGYYLNPLMNVVLGRIVLKERLTRLQWTAVIIAALGVSALALEALNQLWISLALCVSFATYGLLRKIAPVDSLAGLSVETGMIFPVALAWLLWGLAAGQPSFGANADVTALLLLAGIVSTTPLLLFTGAARRLRYSTLGMLQFIAPTLQFLLAVLVYGEAFTTAHAIAFGAIWLALALYVAELAREARAAAAVALPE